MNRALPPLLAVSYLLLAHASASTANPTFALLAGFVLAVLLLWPGLLRGQWATWLGLAVAGAGLLWLQQQALGALLLYAPPVMLNLFMSWLFGHTLLAGKQPLIEQVVRAMAVHPEPLDPAIVAYARRLTGLWSLLFALLGLLSLGLALLARPDGLLLTLGIEPIFDLPQSIWSLFANVLNYVIIGLMFVLEFAYRRRRFANLPYRSLREFLQRMLKLGPDFWRRAAR